MFVFSMTQIKRTETRLINHQQAKNSFCCCCKFWFHFIRQQPNSHLLLVEQKLPIRPWNCHHCETNNQATACCAALLLSNYRLMWEVILIPPIDQFRVIKASVRPYPSKFALIICRYNENHSLMWPKKKNAQSRKKNKNHHEYFTQNQHR